MKAPSIALTETQLLRELKEVRAALEAVNASRATLEHVALDAIEDDRRRLAQTLHDTICQSMSGICLLYRVLGLKLKLVNAAPLPEYAELGAAVQYATEDIHRLAGWLRPPELDSSTLISALAQLTDSVSHRIQCDLDCPEPVAIEDHFAASQLVQIAHEAAQEALLCRGIRHISISLSRQGDVILMSLRHDGSAAPVEPYCASHALLQFRAQAIGATLAVSTEPEGEAIITCKLPVHSRP
jgi:signal transduction histidine kinase